MGMTVTEKLLARAAGLDRVEPGQVILADVDLAMGNDITAPLAIAEFRKAGAKRVFDPERVVLVCDHFTPNKDIKSAEQVKMVREFAREQGIKYYWEGGRVGIEHALLPEQGISVPGDVIVGADSHSCTMGGVGAFSTGVGSTDLAAAFITGKTWFRVPPTLKFFYEGKRDPWVTGKDMILHTIGLIGVDGAMYKAMEFTGPAVADLEVEDRLTMANMAIEAGGKDGIFEADRKAEEYMRDKAHREPRPLWSDPDASYERVDTINVEEIEPTVACPNLPSNTRPAAELGEVQLDQVVIGSCTNGKISDLRQAAAILKGRKVHPNVRMIVLPATQAIYSQALEEGLLATFVDAEGMVSTPSCGPCLGGHLSVLAAGEVALSTTNRNFNGRMGHPDAKIYLCSPAVAAASAVAGRIVHPAEIAD
jgi:3-isopropylmalate/(R)-2-methylmalate dehydratase large subunit